MAFVSSIVTATQMASCLSQLAGESKNKREKKSFLLFFLVPPASWDRHQVQNPLLGILDASQAYLPAAVRVG